MNTELLAALVRQWRGRAAACEARAEVKDAQRAVLTRGAGSGQLTDLNRQCWEDLAAEADRLRAERDVYAQCANELEKECGK